MPKLKKTVGHRNKTYPRPPPARPRRLPWRPSCRSSSTQRSEKWQTSKPMNWAYLCGVCLLGLLVLSLCSLSLLLVLGLLALGGALPHLTEDGADLAEGSIGVLSLHLSALVVGEKQEGRQRALRCVLVLQTKECQHGLRSSTIETQPYDSATTKIRTFSTRLRPLAAGFLAFDAAAPRPRLAAASPLEPRLVFLLSSTTHLKFSKACINELTPQHLVATVQKCKYQ